MARKVYLVGCGMGGPGMLTADARRIFEESVLVIGSQRLIDGLGPFSGEVRVLVRSAEIAQAIRTSPADSIAVLLSGDAGFFSGARPLLDLLEGDPALDVKVVPGISSVQYLCAALHTSWDDAYLASVHGRASDVAGIVQAHPKTFLLAGGETKAHDVCACLAERGLSACVVRVGERLGYPDERIVSGSPEDLACERFGDLSCLLIENPAPIQRLVGAPALPDAAFVRGDVPMTKEEVRAVAIAKLRIPRDACVWDVGAGTGSVSVEAAFAAPSGRVLAIERHAEACALIRRNAAALGASNVTVVEGEAPAALAGLPTPDCVFVGGAGMRLEAILHAAIQVNPQVRLVVAAVTIETLAAATAAVAKLGLRNVDIAQIAVAKAREAGAYHLMEANNPVYLISADGPVDPLGPARETVA